MAEVDSDTVCPVCAGVGWRRDRPYKGHHHIFSGRNLLRCDDCAMVFVGPMPSDEEWEAYNREFFSESLGGMPDTREVELFDRGMALLRLDYIAASAGYANLPDSLLEIGPGVGHFYKAYKGRHPGVDRYGAVETDASCRETLRGMEVEAVASLDELAPEARFDLAVLSHVLEHCARPREFLGAVLDHLYLGGGLFVEVPCRDFEYKPVYDAHILFFDKAPMARLLSDLGLSDFRISYHGEPIAKLKRQLSRVHRVLDRFRSAVAGGAEQRPSGDALSTLAPEMERVIRPFMPHIESEQPARWLRVFARKPE